MFADRKFMALAATSALFLAGTALCVSDCLAAPIAVGASKIEITPNSPVLLAGYGGRPGEYEGIDTPLWARALAIGDEQPLLVIAVDNCGVPAEICDRVAGELAGQVGTPRSRIVVCSTHTHNAPTLTGYAPVVWGGHSTPAQQARVDQYTEWLARKLVDVGVAASDARQPAELAWGQSRVGFGGNRRAIEGGKWVGFGHQRDAPVDHSLPLMVATATDGTPLAVWVSYACHCTTVGSRNYVGGDWAGAANDALEQKFPGAIAVTTIGCGADVGPVPDAGLDAARRYGRQIADTARAICDDGQLSSLFGPIEATRQVVPLPLADAPSRAALEELAAAEVPYRSDWARRMVKQLDRDGTLQTHVDLPLTTWSFGRDLGIVFLGGEVVVDYSHRLKRELDWRRLWINAWAGDVPCYIPSRRILAEGGYEADFSMIYYAKPAPFAPQLEDLLAGRVVAALGEDFRAPPDAKPFPYGRRDWTADVRQQIRAAVEAVRATSPELLSSLAAAARDTAPGYDALVSEDVAHDSWFIFSGDRQRRPYIRQQQAGVEIRWRTATLREVRDDQPVTIAFLGGVGWQSDPETDGFVLVAGDREIRFDVTRRPAVWSSGDVSLLYLPTWTSNVDSAGMFYLTLPAAMTTAGEALELSVRSLGSGSRRWFALDKIKHVDAVNHLVREAVHD